MLGPENVTFGGSGGIKTTTRPELPYPCIFKIKLFELLGNLLLLILLVKEPSWRHKYIKQNSGRIFLKGG